MRSLEPFPGPRPFTEDEYQIFFGRRSEVDRIADMIDGRRFIVLSGPSGVGKTSLLRAGVIARLRLHRAIDTSIPPVIVLREWSSLAKGRAAFVPLLQKGMEEARKGMTPQEDGSPALFADDEAEWASRPVTGAGPAQAIADLASRTKAGEVILVLDQFEEALRLGQTASKEALAFVSEVLQTGKARVLVSLREEFLGRLKPLERANSTAQGLRITEATFYLDAMSSKEAEQALFDSALECEVSFHPDVRRDISGWVNAHSDAVAATSPEPDAPRRTFLLLLQALSREVYESARSAAGGRRGALTIAPAELDRYRDGRPPSEVVGKALARWIEGSLSQRAENEPAPPPGFGLDDDELRALLVRITARMGSTLSSGGYKSPRKLPELREDALADDKEALGANPDERSLSGPARASRHGWPPESVIPFLHHAFAVAVRRLEARNILKAGADIERDDAELVHDGLGRPLKDWGDQQRRHWHDIVASVTNSRGRDIVGDLITGANWRAVAATGASFTGEKNERATIRDLTFDRCDFTGVAFVRCDLEGVTFRGCDLEGTVFIDCRFFGVVIEGDEPVLGMTIKGTMEMGSAIGALSIKSALIQGTFTRTDITGTFDLAKARIRLTQFTELRGPGKIVLPDPAHGRFNAWDEPSSRFGFADKKYADSGELTKDSP